VEVIRIEGVAFELEDAREFYERVVVYVGAKPRAPDAARTLYRALAS
jgi:hypothetical protein